MTKRSSLTITFAVSLTLVTGALSADPPGESGAIGDRLDQATVESMSYSEAVAEGKRLFTTPFNRLDGFGDGPINFDDTIAPGGRPTLQGNGMFLRLNGLDAQSCFECHSVVSNATIPATLGVGGAGGSNSNAVIQPDAIDMVDLDLDGSADFNGRFANPPAVFGDGGVELVGLEMTTDLQALKQQAIDNPGTPVQLLAKGVDFGTIVADTLGNLDTSLVEGVSEDLVIRPFGRKGAFATTRDFGLGAMMFHFGMQPMEIVGVGNDADGDTVVDEITVGEISALSVFMSSLKRPGQTSVQGSAAIGMALFNTLGCADCHVPFIDASTRILPLRFPQVATDPSQNVYRYLDLSLEPASFGTVPGGGIRVAMFADLKRHDMGPDLAEDFALADAATNREFTTAKLWGVADSGPWLHDGRAHTLTDAILMHGGEAQVARDAFDVLIDDEKISVLAFLRTLRSPATDDNGDDGDDGGHDGDDDDFDFRAILDRNGREFPAARGTDVVREN